MTWHYQIADDFSSMDVWDHTQDPASDTPVASIANDGSGFDIPGDVLEVMRQEVDPELPEAAESGNAGNSYGLSQRGGQILRDMSIQNIEEYTG